MGRGSDWSCRVRNLLQQYQEHYPDQGSDATSVWNFCACFSGKSVVTSRNVNCFLKLRINSGGVYMRKLSPARVSHWDDLLISYRVYMMTGSFHILLFKGTFHVAKIHVRFKIANITHTLPVPVYRQTDFTPKRLVVSRLHDTIARFRTGGKFSPRYENRGELTPG